MRLAYKAAAGSVVFVAVFAIATVADWNKGEPTLAQLVVYFGLLLLAPLAAYWRTVKQRRRQSEMPASTENSSSPGQP